MPNLPRQSSSQWLGYANPRNLDNSIFAEPTLPSSSGWRACVGSSDYAQSVSPSGTSRRKLVSTWAPEDRSERRNRTPCARASLLGYGEWGAKDYEDVLNMRMELEPAEKGVMCDHTAEMSKDEI